MPPAPKGVGLLQALVFRMQEKTIANAVFSAPENLKDFPLLRNENCNLLPSLKRDGFHFGHNNFVFMALFPRKESFCILQKY